MPDTVTGKRFVILGGSSGIGFGVAKLVLEQGAGEVIIGSSNQKRIDAAVEKLKSSAKSGAKVWGKTIDMSEIENVPPFFKDLGNFDHLISTVGRPLPTGSFPDSLDLVEVRSMENDRFWSCMRAIQCSYKQINKGGSIITTTGSVVKHPLPGWSAVSGIAGAIETATKSMAFDLKPIRVNCVAPGFVVTEMWDHLPDEKKDAMLAKAASELPVGHVGTPDEIAEAYLYLLRGTYTTGQTLFVEGGRAIM